MRDEDNRRLIASVTKWYAGKLPREDIRYGWMTALFRCLRWHQYNRGNKFTTSLYRFLKWELNRSLRDHIRSKKSSMLPLDESEIAGVDYSLKRELDDCMDRLSEEESMVLNQRFVHGMSTREIGESNGYSHTKASRNVDRAMKRLKEIYVGTR